MNRNESSVLATSRVGTPPSRRELKNMSAAAPPERLQSGVRNFDHGSSDMYDINHIARFQVPPERVYSALGSTDYVRQWWWKREARLGAKDGRTARLEGICRRVDGHLRVGDPPPASRPRLEAEPGSSSIPG